MTGPIGFHSWLHLLGAVLSTMILIVVFFAFVRETCLGIAKAVSKVAAMLRERSAK